MSYNKERLLQIGVVFLACATLLGVITFQGLWERSAFAQVPLQFDVACPAGTAVYSQLLALNPNTGRYKAIVCINGSGDFTLPKVKLTDQGQCTMAAGTCSAQTLAYTYTAAPLCWAVWTGTGTDTGFIKLASTTTTVTPSSSVGTDTAQVNWFCAGN